MCALPRVKQIVRTCFTAQGAPLGAHPRGVGPGCARREVQEGGAVYIHRADSLHCTARK